VNYEGGDDGEGMDVGDFVVSVELVRETLNEGGLRSAFLEERSRGGEDAEEVGT